jgi:hypothetical protein
MRSLAVLKLAAATMAAAVMMAVPAGVKAQAGDTVLKQAEIEKLLPAKRVLQGTVGDDATAQLGRREVCRWERTC